MDNKELETTPQYAVKPHLVWVGKLLGSDIYADIGYKESSLDHQELIQHIIEGIE